MKRLILLFTVVLLIVGCNVNNPADSDQGNNISKNFEELDVASNFNWSNTGFFKLTLSGDANLVEGKRVKLMDGNKQVSSAVMRNGEYSFAVTIPNGLTEVEVVCEALGFRETVSTNVNNQTINVSGIDTVKANRIDSDGDGVDDLDDDFPADPEKATLVRIPYDQEDYWIFEDLWPDKGDYDFNDLVIREYVEIHMSASNAFIGGYAKLWLNAIGANFHNSIFVHFMEADLVGGQIVYNELPDPNFIESIETFLPNIRIDEYTPNTIGAWYDIEWEEFGYQNNGMGPQDFPHSREFAFTFDQTVVPPSNIMFEWYISSGYTRGREVHHPMYAPTVAANPAFFNTGDDATDIPNEFYYKTALNHPWVVKVWGRFPNPLEFVQITEAYPLFQDWAESNGTMYPNWQDTYIQEKVFDEYSAK